MKLIYLFTCKRVEHMKENASAYLDLLQTQINASEIQYVRLNPNQLNIYYTNPHALLYDLKQTRIQIDYLIIHSRKDIEDFINIYPAKWLLLKSYFTDVLFTEETDLKQIG